MSSLFSSIMFKLNNYWKLIALSTILLEGCISNQKCSAVVPRAFDERAKKLVVDIHNHEYQDLMSSLATSLNPREVEAAADHISSMMVTDDMSSQTLVGCVITTKGRSRNYYLTYHIEDKNGKYHLIDLVLQEQSQGNSVAGFHIAQYNHSLDDMHKFSFDNMQNENYICLGLLVIFSIYVPYILYRCIGMQVKNKLAWCVFILLGITAITINWTTGEINANIFSINLLWVSIHKGSYYTPYMIRISPPIGAIWFRIIYDKQIRRVN